MSATVERSEMYHGEGRKSIRHHIPTTEGEVRVAVTVSPGRERPGVRLFVEHNGHGPNTLDRIHSHVIIYGWDPRPEGGDD